MSHVTLWDIAKMRLLRKLTALYVYIKKEERSISSVTGPRFFPTCKLTK